MKRLFLFIAIFLIVSVNGASNFEFKYKGAGAGGRVNLVLAEKSWDNRLPIGAFGFSVSGLIDFSLGKAGSFQYVPSFELWFRSMERSDGYWDIYKRNDAQILINIGDIKYQFPSSKNLSIRPYAGLGFCIVIDFEGYEYIHYAEPLSFYVEDIDSWNDITGGFNSFIGLDFNCNGNFRPFVENRFTLANKWSYKLSAGCVFHF